MIAKLPIRAVVWDYDGTLADTRQKNLNVTRRIFEDVTGRGADEVPALLSLAEYEAANRRSSNWRELYQREFDLDEGQIDEAGRCWTPYQLNDATAVPFFDGVVETVRALKVPHGIVSQNSSRTITQVLRKKALLPYFGCIVGYEEVGLTRQKPEPDGLLDCIAALADSKTQGQPGSGREIVLYVGDHETDAQCAHRANCELENRRAPLKIISVGAFYDNGTDTADWAVRPDFTVARVTDILTLMESIGQRGDITGACHG